MNRDQQISDIFLAACELDVQDQAGYLDKVCGDDAVLRAEVESLLQHDNPDTLIEGVPTGVAGSAGRGLPVSAIDLPGYEIFEEIGRGGLGVVFKARQNTLNRIVAVKMLLPRMFPRSNDLERFRQEADAVAKLQHPNVVQIFDVIEVADNHCLSMEFVEGGNLADGLDGRPQPPAVAARLVEVLARAMHVVHESGYLHRDLKPANILLAATDNDSDVRLITEDGKSISVQPKITDFGLARQLGEDSGLTDTGTAVGTPSYMPPEQARSGQTVTHAVDVYSLGAILYEMLVGRPPFRGSSVLETLSQVYEQQPVPPRQLVDNVPMDLEAVCLKCLEKEPLRRYPSAGALADDLRRFQDGLPTIARPVTSTERCWRWCRRNPVVAGLISLAIVLLLAGTGVSTGFGILASRRAESEKVERDRADREASASKRNEQLAERRAKEADDARGQVEQVLKEKAIEADRAQRNLALSRAARSAALKTETPIHSLFIAIEALKTWTDDRGEPVPAAVQSLQGALHNVAGIGLCGQDGPINAAAISPDNHWLITGSGNNTRLWDLTEPDPLLTVRVLEGQRNVRAVEISPDSRWAVTGSADRTVRLWDLSAEDPVQSHLDLAGHQRGVTALAISPNSRWLVSGSDDSTALVWDLTAEHPEQTGRRLAGHRKQVLAVAISPNNRWLTTGSFDGTARLWDLTADDPSESVRVLAGHEIAIEDVAFSPDSHWVVTGSRDSTARLWDLTADDPGKAVRVLAGHKYPVNAIAITPDSHWLVTGSGDRTARLWDLTAENPMTDLVLRGHENYVTAMAISPDGHWLVTGSRDKTARLWDLTADDPTEPVHV